VEPRREPVDVLAIDRCDETLIDALIHRRRQEIRFVLDVLDRGDVFVDVRYVAEQRVEQLRRRGEMAGELIEQLEELFVAWKEAAEHGGPESGVVVRAGATPPKIPVIRCQANPPSRRHPMPLITDRVSLGDETRVL